MCHGGCSRTQRHVLERNGMGSTVSAVSFSHQARQRYREKVQRCLDALARMLSDGSFADSEPSMGLEIELNLVDEDLQPAMANSVVLEKLDDPAFTIELAQHN